MAGETPELKIPYPSGTDPLKEGASKAQALAEKIDLLFRKQLTKLMEVAKLKVTETLEVPTGFALVATNNTYGTFTERAINTPFEPSATRMALVVLIVQTSTGKASGEYNAAVGAINEVAFEKWVTGAQASITNYCSSFLVPPGKKWEWGGKVSEGSITARSTYLLL